MWTFPLRRKSDAPAPLIAFYSYVSTQFGCSILALQTYNAKGCDNLTIRHLVSTHGNVFHLTCPYTSQENSRAECILCTINACVCTLLFHAHMPPKFWHDALATAILLIYLRPCRSPGTMLLIISSMAHHLPTTVSESLVVGVTLA